MLYRKPNAMTPGTIAQQTAARVAQGGAYGNVNNPAVVSPMGWGGEKSTPPPQSLINFMQQSGRGYMPNKPGWQNLYGGGLQSSAGGATGGSQFGGTQGGVDVAGGTAGFYGPGGGGFVQNQPQIPGAQYPNQGQVVQPPVTGGTGTPNTGTPGMDTPFSGSAAGPRAGNPNIYAMQGGAARQAAPFQDTTQSNPATAGQAAVPGTVYQPPVAVAPDSIWSGAKRSNTMGYGDPNAPIQRDWSPIGQSGAQVPVRQGANSTATPNVLGNNAGSLYATKNKAKATRTQLQKNANYPTAKTPVGTIKPGEMAAGQALLKKQAAVPQLQESLRQGTITQQQYDAEVAKLDQGIAAAKQNVQALGGTTTPAATGGAAALGGPGMGAPGVAGAEGEAVTDTPFGAFNGISPGIGASRTSYDPNTGQTTVENNPSVGSIHDPQTGFQNQVNLYNSVGAGNQSGMRGGFNETAVGNTNNQQGSSGTGTSGTPVDPSGSWGDYLGRLGTVGNTPTTPNLGTYDTGNSDLNALLKMYQDQYNQARQTNLERYGQIMGGYENLYNNATGYQDQQAQDLLGGYQGRYDRNMGYIGDYGKQQAEDLTAQYDVARGQEEQDLLNRGLGNTTVRSGVMRGLTESEADSQARLQEAITRMKMGYDTQLSGDTLAAQQAMGTQGLQLRTQIPQNTLDFMERRTDEYPSLDQAIQLAMMSGQASGATQPGITGPAQPVMPNPGGQTPGGQLPGGQTPGGTGINNPGGYGGHGQVDPSSGLPAQGPQQGNSNPVRKSPVDGKLYRWNPATKKWEKVVGAEGSGETPTEGTGLPTLPPEEPGTGSGEAGPPTGTSYGNMYDPSFQNLSNADLPQADYLGNPQAAGIPGVTGSPTMQNYDPRMLAQWAANRQAMLYPNLG